MTTIQRFLLDDQPEPVSHYCHAVRAGDFESALLEKPAATLSHLLNVGTDKTHFLGVEFAQCTHGGGGRCRNISQTVARTI